MKKYRIVEIPKSVPPMWRLEESKKRSNSRYKQEPENWMIVCLAADRGILEGVRDDIIGQTAETHNGLRE